MVDSVMEENDETTISQLKHSLKSRGIDLIRIMEDAFYYYIIIIMLSNLTFIT